MESFALSRNKNNFLMTKNIFNMLSTLNIHIDCTQPLINFGFISNLSQKDMILTIINDHGSIVTFIKIVPQKDKKHIPKDTCFCIPKSFCSYYHYESSTILNDDIFELFNVDPDFVNSIVTFKKLDDVVDLSSVDEYGDIQCFIGEEEIECKISAIRNDELNSVVAYYIKRDKMDYIHCFMKQEVKYNSDVDTEMLTRIIEENLEREDVEVEEITLELCNYLNRTECGSSLIDFIGVYNNKSEKTKQKFPLPQKVNIHIATFISQVLLKWIFPNI